MQQDWEDSELFDRRELEYFDTLQDNNYTSDYNGNVHDFHKEKEKFPF